LVLPERSAKKGSQGCRASRRGFFAAVFLAEFFHSSRGVHDFLLAGVKRVAYRAYFDVQRLAQRGAGFEFVAAAAGYCDFFVFRVDIRFHRLFLAEPEGPWILRKAQIMREILEACKAGSGERV
jgi:hypothetical protein